MQGRIEKMCKFLTVCRRRQFFRFDSRFQAVHDRFVDLCIHLDQLRINRVAMRANFCTEIADQAPVAKVSLLEKIELNIEPLAQTLERFERVVPEGFRDVLLDHCKIADEEFEAEGFFRLEVVRE